MALLLAVAGLWLPFGHLYLLNAPSLTLPLAVHLPRLLLLGGGLALAAFALQSLVPARRRAAVTAALLLAGAALWAEGVLLIGDYGFFQGAAPDWAAARPLLAAEAALAVLLVAAFVRWRRRLARDAAWLAALLVVAGLPLLAGPLRGARPDAGARHTFTREGVLDLSRDRNVLLFIVDTLQADVLVDLLAREPDRRGVFAGFTAYPDAVSAFPKTYLSVPNILTGRAFANAQPYPAFLREAYLDGSAPRRLHDRGWDVRYHSFTWLPYLPDPRVADNLAEIGSAAGRRWMQRREFVRLANLVLFRLAPHALKPVVYNDDRFLIAPPAPPADAAGGAPALADSQRAFSGESRNGDLVLLDRMLAFLRAGREAPAFRVFHLEGCHFPLELDPDLRDVGWRPRTGEAFADQTAAMVRLLELVFARLRELGVWDRSLVIVAGDHGAGEFADLPAHPDALARLGLDRRAAPAADPFLRELVRGGTPALLVKPFGAAGPLAWDLRRAALEDIPATIADQVGLPAPPQGRSLLAPDPDPARVRRHRFYRFAGTRRDFIVPLTEYRVDGFAWDPAAWAPTGRDLNGAAAAAFDGRLIVMGAGGNLDAFPHAGWTPPLDHGRFMAGGEASLTVPVPPGAGPLAVEVRLKRDYAPAAPTPLTVRVNGETVAVWPVSREGPPRRRAPLPPSLGREGGPLEIVFAYPPDEDEDPLFVEVRVAYRQHAPAYAPGTVIDFAAGGNAARWQGDGWGPAEDWGAWTLGREAALHLDPGGPADRPLELGLEIMPALFGDAPPVAAALLAGGRVAAEWRFAEAGWRTVTASLPADAAAGRLDLVLRVENPRAPADLGLSADTRQLGLGVRRAVLRRR